MTPPDHSEDNAGPRLRRALSRLASFEFRDAWWQFLDVLEARRALRRTLYAAGVLAILGVVASVWIYPWWRQRTAVSMARQWLAAGRLDHASETIQQALKVAPDLPESWKLAADLARRLGNYDSALTYSRKAAELAPADLDLVLAWASDGLLANQPEEAETALASLPAATLAPSALAQRIAGELARRRRDFDTARARFEDAVRLDGPSAVNEVPLGVVLLNARDPALRRRGEALLSRWTTDPEWGANASRTLLQDAIARDDRTAMFTWAESLRTHPRCTLGDIPNCLLALSRTNETRFAEVLSVLEKNHAGDSANAALLISWLNQIGRARDAVRWMQNLDPSLIAKPPAAVGAAESLRQVGDWSALLARAQAADWGRDLDPVRLAYALLAARRSGRTDIARDLWDTLQARATTDGGRTLFIADSLYAWDLREDALTLLWSASDLPDIAFQALGTLARHYQIERDAAGQYRVFKRLHSLRPRDSSIANNYALFSALTGSDLRIAEQIAAENFRQAPANLAFRSTYALVLCVQNRPQEALVLLQSVIAGGNINPVVALPYGLALAATRQKSEARSVLASLPSETLTKEETALIGKALN